MNDVDPAAFDRARDRLKAQSPEYLTIQEVADLARCEHKTVRRAIAAGSLVAFKTGARYVIREEDARAWIESRPAGAGGAQRPRRPRPRLPAGSVARLREIETKLGN